MGSALVQMMAGRLFGAKTLSKPVLAVNLKRATMTQESIMTAKAKAVI